MKTIFLAIIAFIACNCSSMAQVAQKQTYSVSLNLTRLKVMPAKVYLIYFKKSETGLESTTDSAIVNKGIANFSGFTEEPLAAALRSKMFNNGIFFCLAPGNIIIDVGSVWEKYNVVGSPYQQDFDMICKLQEQYQLRLNSIGEQIKVNGIKNDSVKLSKYQNEFTKVSRQMYDSVFKAYVITHAKTSALSLFALNIYASVDKGLITDSLYNLLSPSFKKMPTAVLIKKELDQSKSLMIGHSAPLFSQKDMNGKTVNLLSFKGKYVLIDFWASWCQPCRAVNPNLIVLYKKYHQKGFEILGVSLDEERSKNSWIKAIQDDHINLWTQVSDLKGWYSEVVKKYSIKFIPQNYLINPNGDIVAKNLGIDELTKKLDELL